MVLKITKHIGILKIAWEQAGASKGILNFQELKKMDQENVEFNLLQQFRNHLFDFKIILLNRSTIFFFESLECKNIFRKISFKTLTL